VNFRKLNLFGCLLALGILAGPDAVWSASGPVVIISQPQDRKVLEGMPATFSVGVDGTPPFQYQWLRNGLPIPYATSDSYILATTSFGDNGTAFSVNVTNALGDASSSLAVLGIDPGILVTQTVSLVAVTNVWKFNQAGFDLGTTWLDPGYNDNAWPAGAGVLDANVPPRGSVGGEVVRTQLALKDGGNNSILTYYFRARFSFTNANAVSAGLRANVLVDDGAAFYLNGAEVYRLGLSPGALYSDAATRTGPPALHYHGLADRRLGDIQAVDIEIVVVLGIGDGRFENLLYLAGNPALRELKFGQSRFAVLAANDAGDQVELLRADSHLLGIGHGFVVGNRTRSGFLAHD